MSNTSEATRQIPKPVPVNLFCDEPEILLLDTFYEPPLSLELEALLVEEMTAKQATK